MHESIISLLVIYYPLDINIFNKVYVSDKTNGSFRAILRDIRYSVWYYLNKTTYVIVPKMQVETRRLLILSTTPIPP